MKNPETKQGRIDYIIEMMNFINPNEFFHVDSEIRGTTIRRLCEFNGAPYQRIKKWCESKMPQEPQEDFNLGVVKPYEDDAAKFEKYSRQCLELMKERNLKYGNSWRTLSVSSIANIIEMKMHRVANMENIDPKVVDEFMDALNYAIMGLMKVNNE